MRIAVVCLGNICRSPIGEYLLRAEAAKQGLELEVCSGGTGTWHLNEPAHKNSIAVLSEVGQDASAHRARQFTPEWFDQHDLIVVMDRQNERAVLELARDEGDRAKVRMLRSFDPDVAGDLEVPDPYGEPIESYRSVAEMVQRAVAGLVATQGY